MNELIKILTMRKNECEVVLHQKNFWEERDIDAFSLETIAYTDGKLDIINEILSRINSGDIK